MEEDTKSFFASLVESLGASERKTMIPLPVPRAIALAMQRVLGGADALLRRQAGHILEDARAVLREKTEPIFDEARILGELVVDVGTFTAKRLRSRYKTVEPRPDLVEVVLAHAAAELSAATRELAVCVAQEKRTAQFLKKEAASAREWTRTETAAKERGEQTRAAEAFEHARRHTEQAQFYQTQWESQTASVERGKQAIRTLNHAIQNARRAQERIALRRNSAEAQSKMQQTLQTIDAAVRFIDALGVAEITAEGAAQPP